MAKNLLRIDTSSRPERTSASDHGGSYSKEMASHLVNCMTARYPDMDIVDRDLLQTPLPHLSNNTIKGFFTPDHLLTDDLATATALSDVLIGEIITADILVISMPIYNFSVPSRFKAWIDQIVRMGRTFAYEDGNFRGLLENKQAYICYAYGAPGYLNDGPLSGYDFMAPYVKMILNFIGITEITAFAMEATTADEATVQSEQDKAFALINDHFQKSVHVS